MACYFAMFSAVPLLVPQSPNVKITCSGLGRCSGATEKALHPQPQRAFRALGWKKHAPSSLPQQPINNSNQKLRNNLPHSAVSAFPSLSS